MTYNAEKDVERISDFNQNIVKDSIRELSNEEVLRRFGRVCVLDPKSPDILVPGDAEKFDTFLFGGVLGNHPMDGRTERELTARLPIAGKRHLGEVQLPTDQAVIVCDLILRCRADFNDLRFVDFPEVVITDCETTQLYFRYIEKQSYLQYAKECSFSEENVKGSFGDRVPLFPAGINQILAKDCDLLEQLANPDDALA